MRNRIWVVFAIAAALGCSAAMILAANKPRTMRWAIGSDGCCPVCGEPQRHGAGYCSRCGKLLIWRKEK